jgi:hypothetical protein
MAGKITPVKKVDESNAGSENQLLSGYTRRYFVEDLVGRHSELFPEQLKGAVDDTKSKDCPDDMAESKHTFLKFFDVDIQPSVVKMEDAGPGSHLRIYYSDFLDSTEHEATKVKLIKFWNSKKNNIEHLFAWVCGLKPRSKTDAFPMLLMVQEMLKTVIGEHLEVT